MLGLVERFPSYSVTNSELYDWKTLNFSSCIFQFFKTTVTFPAHTKFHLQNLPKNSRYCVQKSIWKYKSQSKVGVLSCSHQPDRVNTFKFLGTTNFQAKTKNELSKNIMRQRGKIKLSKSRKYRFIRPQRIIIWDWCKQKHKVGLV